MNDKSVLCEEMNIDDSISASKPSGTLRAACPDVLQCSSLLDAIRFIVYHNTHQKNIATLSVSQEEVFIIIEKLRVCPQTMFKCLHDHFAEHFDIYLYIIAFDNGKFSLMNKINQNKKHTAFVTFNKDHTIRGPLYTKNVNGTTKTVFTGNNHDILIDVYMYIDQLNDIKSSTGSPQIQEQQAVYCEHELQENLSTNNIPASTDQFPECTLDTKTQFRYVLEQTLQQMFRTIDGLPLDPHISSQVLQEFVSRITTFEDLSPQLAIMASKDGINHLCHLVQLAEQPVFIYQNDESQPQFSSDLYHQTVEMNEIPFNTSLPNNTTDIIETYASPTLIKPLEKTNHPRKLREFFEKTVSAPIKCVNSNQRDPIQIKVPPDDGITLYLDMQSVDTARETHRSKILVPHKTKVENESLMNNNDLKCLNFSKCDKANTFNRVTKHFYSEISLKERQKLQKDIRIHMINLYQTCGITKQIIQDKDLKKCQLAFSFCILDNGEYKRVSPIYYSNVIEDSKESTNKKKKTVKKDPKRLSKPSINTIK